jgi:hypothetical protein
MLAQISGLPPLDGWLIHAIVRAPASMPAGVDVAEPDAPAVAVRVALVGEWVGVEERAPLVESHPPRDKAAINMANDRTPASECERRRGAMGISVPSHADT